MAPAINAAHWLSADDSLTLPPWTRADDEHNDYETASSKRREFLRKTPLQDPIPYIIARDDASNAAPPVGDDLTSDSDGAESLSDSDGEEEEEKEEVKEEGTVTKDPVETTTPEAPPTTTSNISYTGDQKSITVSVSSVIVEPGTGTSVGETKTTERPSTTTATATPILTTLTPAIPLPSTKTTTTTTTTRAIGTTSSSSSRTTETPSTSYASSTSTTSFSSITKTTTTTTTTQRSTETSRTSSTSPTPTSTTPTTSKTTTQTTLETIQTTSSEPPPSPGFSSHIHLTDATALPIYTNTDSSAPASTQADVLKITPQNGIHSEVHKVLIGVGSVVGFILLLGLCLIAWKLTKRNRRRKAAIQRNLGFHKPSRGSALLNQFPFLKKRFGSKEWFTIPDPNHQNMAEKKLHLNIPTSTVRHETRFYSPDKPRGVAGLGIVNPVVAKSVATSNAKSVAGDVSPLSTTTNSNTPVDTGTAVAMTVTRHVPKPSVSSIQAQANNTMTSAYAPQPIYGPHRQTFYSDMSSLSSGFGDTDIIIPPPAPAATAPPQHHTSWHSSKSSGSGRRDTMYTEASEDTPARFRTVTSWVRQQTGRVKRAQEKDTPPVPGLPLEQEFGMMMPDGEVPRRVDMTMGGTAAY